MTLHHRDRRGAASPCYRDRATTSVLMCKQKPYPVWFSCRCKSYMVYRCSFKCLRFILQVFKWTSIPFDIKTNQPASTTPPFPSGGLVCLITSTITDPLSVLVLRISSSLLLAGDKTMGKGKKQLRITRPSWSKQRG